MILRRWFLSLYRWWRYERPSTIPWSERERRLAEQAMVEYRGTFIVMKMTTRKASRDGSPAL
jgi:hypothetical protein